MLESRLIIIDSYRLNFLSSLCVNRSELHTERLLQTNQGYHVQTARTPNMIPLSVWNCGICKHLWITLYADSLRFRK